MSVQFAPSTVGNSVLYYNLFSLDYVPGTESWRLGWKQAVKSRHQIGPEMHERSRLLARASRNLGWTCGASFGGHSITGCPSLSPSFGEGW